MLSDSMAQALSEKKVKCLCCTYENQNENEFLDHVRIHRFEKNYKIPCAFCPQTLKTVKLFYKHKKSCPGRKPNNDQQNHEVDIQSNFFWGCEHCPQKIQINIAQDSNDFNHVTEHLYVHSRNGETVKCPVLSCNKSYEIAKSFSNHYNIHKVREEFEIKNHLENESTDATESENEQEIQLVNTDSNVASDVESNSDELQETVDLALAQTQEKMVKSHAEIAQLNAMIQSSEAKFALKMSSISLLPRHTVNDIFSFCDMIHQMKMELIVSKLENKFVDIENLNISDVNETINLVDDVAGLGSQLLTHHMREKVLNLHFQFITPKVTRIYEKSYQLHNISNPSPAETKLLKPQ